MSFASDVREVNHPGAHDPLRKPLNPKIVRLPHVLEALDVRAFWVAGEADPARQTTHPETQPCYQEGCEHMRTIDFAPLYRSVVGFDRLADLLDTATAETATGYPPYNIERTDENAYRIDIAVAGFRPDELEIEVKENLLTVTGRKAANEEPRRYLHRGLAERDFQRRFQLADYVLVTDANLADGLLSVTLKRELPEALKPRRIEIGTTAAASLIQGEKAA
jgi:molecular chaperone IbpA